MKFLTHSRARIMSMSYWLSPESKKEGESRNQVLEEGFESEEGWHEILNIWLNFVTIQPFWVEQSKINCKSLKMSA